MSFSCPWLERTSASLDGELPMAEVELVHAHAQSCRVCGALLESAQHFEPVNRTRESSVGSFEVGLSRSSIGRLLLALSGVLLGGFALVGFLEGSGDSADLHNIRHLSIWQASLGVSVVALAVSFRLSLFLVTITISFLSLTAIATLFDVLQGHRGPWTDITHLVEVCALCVLLFLSRPHLRLLRESKVNPIGQGVSKSDRPQTPMP